MSTTTRIKRPDNIDVPPFDPSAFDAAIKEATGTAPKPIRRRFSVRTPAGKRADRWVNVVHERDPKTLILDAIGQVPDGVVQFSRILVAICQPPIVEKTSGGVFLSQSIQDEDRLEHYWQGKVGLIVAMGPQAYEDADDVTFHGTRNAVGDWVWFRPSDGMFCDVNEVACRLFDSERYILGRIPHPDLVS